MNENDERSAYCGHRWVDPAGESHACAYVQTGHPGSHKCGCGARLAEAVSS